MSLVESVLITFHVPLRYMVSTITTPEKHPKFIKMQHMMRILKIFRAIKVAAFP